MELQTRLASTEDQDARSTLERLQHDLRQASGEVTELEAKLTAVETEIETTSARIREVEAEREKAQESELRSMQSLQDDLKEIEKLASTMALLAQQRDDCQRKIRELGALPTEAQSDEYRSLASKELSARLTKNLKKLEKFKHVNRKAIDQFMQLNDKRAELVSKKDELEKGKTAIEELIQNLDLKKDEAIMRTFKGISKNFSSVFQQLVPGGKALLRLEKKAKKAAAAAAAADSDAEDLDDAAAATAEDGVPGPGPVEYHGVEIKVSFSGSDKAFELQQLSGGQKTVVALSLIFAIQKCDPSPFYFFDEVDSALDPVYRTAVASTLFGFF
jgi:structural maintenance of chromosome 3 (chondroitin sulfate proteoglycan 6)